MAAAAAKKDVGVKEKKPPTAKKVFVPSLVRKCRVVLQNLDGKEDEDFNGKNSLGWIRRSLYGDKRSERGGGGKQIPAEELMNEVVHTCLFECRKCGRKILGVQSTTHHQTGCMGHSRREGRRLVSGKYHTCRVCSKVLLCDPHFIRTHVALSHRMVWEKYKELLALKALKSTGLEKKKNTIELLKTKVPVCPKGRTNLVLRPDAVPLENTTFKIANICLFSCSKCGHPFDNLSQLRQHLIKACPKGSGGKRVMLEARYHTCCVCSKRIICDRTAIQVHVREHNVKWKAYLAVATERHRITQTKGHQKEFGTWKEELLLKKEVPTVEPPLPLKCVDKHYFPGICWTSCIANLCLYRCIRCQFKANKWSTLWTHITSCIGSGKFSPLMMVEARYHGCRFCSMVMLCDKKIIKLHYLQTHGMDAGKVDGLGNAGVAVTNEETRLTSSKEPLSEASDINKPEDKASNQNLKEGVRAVPALPLPVNPIGTLPDELTTAKVADLCLFACPRCTYTTAGKKSLYHHVTRVEGLSGRFSKELLQEARYHKCQLCGKVMLCERNTIFCHISRAHSQVSREKYIELCKKT